MIYRGHQDYVFAVAWSPNGRYIASASRDRSVQVWQPSDGKLIQTYRGHEDYLLSLAWSPDGTRIASGCTGGVVQIWDALTGETLFTYRGHARFVRGLAWSPDGRYIASGGDFGDSTVRVWNVASGETGVIHTEQYRIFAVGWSPTENSIASASFDGSVQIWDAFTDQLHLTYNGECGPVYALGWSPDGRAIASAGEDKTVQVWMAATGKLLAIYREHSLPVKTLGWSPAGRYIASAGDDAKVYVWDASMEPMWPTGPMGQRICSYDGHNAWVRTLGWSPDGRVIASACDETVHVWPFRS